MKIDILVIAAHPDDAELCCSGTIIQQIKKGKSVGIIDLTKGEMGTRGTPEIRMAESKEAAAILGLAFRENMGFKDYFFENDEEHQAQLVKKIRYYQPDIVLTNASSDRHPDHGKASELVEHSVFLSGLIKFETKVNEELQAPHRPHNVYHFIQNNYIEPDFIIDITECWDTKIKSVKAYKSQFYDPNSGEPESFISSKGFLDFIEARAMAMGHKIGVKYGEGFTSKKKIGVRNLFDLI